MTKSDPTLHLTAEQVRFEQELYRFARACIQAGFGMRANGLSAPAQFVAQVMDAKARDAALQFQTSGVLFEYLGVIKTLRDALLSAEARVTALAEDLEVAKFRIAANEVGHQFRGKR